MSDRHHVMTALRPPGLPLRRRRGVSLFGLLVTTTAASTLGFVIFVVDILLRWVHRPILAGLVALGSAMVLFILALILILAVQIHKRFDQRLDG